MPPDVTTHLHGTIGLRNTGQWHDHIQGLGWIAKAQSRQTCQTFPSFIPGFAHYGTTDVHYQFLLRQRPFCDVLWFSLPLHSLSLTLLDQNDIARSCPGLQRNEPSPFQRKLCCSHWAPKVYGSQRQRGWWSLIQASKVATNLESRHRLTTDR